MEKEQMFYDSISIKLDHLQVSINIEPGQEDFIWLFLSSTFMFLPLPVRSMFSGILR